jgi:hypothetical protein
MNTSSVLPSDFTGIERIYKHPYIRNFKITASVKERDEVTEFMHWNVSIWFDKTHGVCRDLPLSVDIDAYAFAILHTVDSLYKSNIKWDEKEIEYCNRFYPMDYQKFR